MILKSYICLECINSNSKSANKNEVLQEIAGLAKQNKALEKLTSDEIYQALAKREKQGTTGFGKGIAIPHCKFDTIDTFTVGLVVLKKGINFDALDGKKTNTFFFIIAPEKEKNKHIQILSSISRFLQSEQNKKNMLQANDNAEILEIIRSTSDIKEENKGTQAKVLFHVFIQEERYFDQVLQIFSEVVEGAISVIETENAGHFLHSLPLFSTFWSEDVKVSCKVIIAVVDKHFSNDVIRRINTAVPDIERNPGVMITANELFYTNGSINF